ncbi:MAG: hypothetical protein ACOH1T_00400 [Microbacteriaceae bacterium]
MENFSAVDLAALIAVGAWLALTIVQISTFAKRIVEAARARDYVSRGARRRSTELLWTIPGVAVLGIVLAFGVEVAGRVIFESGSVWGWTVLAFVILFGALAGLGIVAGLIRKERPDYSSIRSDLLELDGQRLSVERIAEFRALLSDADLRQRGIRIGRRNRAGVPDARAELEDISESFKNHAPVGSQAVRSIRWSVAFEVFWRASLIGIIAVLVSIVPWLLLLIQGDWSVLHVIVVLFLATPISIALGTAATRAALAARTAQHAVHLKQRADVVQLLEEFDRNARKGVVGLGDRVARALQILRDQQN